MKRLVAIPLVLLMLAGCGGGSAPSPKAPGSGQTQTGTLGLTFGTQAGSSSTARKGLFLSPNAADASITINGGTAQLFDVTATSTLCQTTAGVRTCAIPLTAPVGIDMISVSLVSSATPPVMLGQGSNSITVVAGTAFSLTVGINPVVASANTITFLPQPGFTYLTASSLSATVTFKDPSGATITGSGSVPNFLTPITLTSSDPHVTISPTTLTTPGQTFSVHYDGSAAAAARITITAMSGSTMVASGPVIAPGLNVTRYNLTTLALFGTIVPAQIVVSSDNKIWWAEEGTHNLGRLDPAVGAGSITHFPTGLGTGPIGVAMGGDGNIWYSGGTTVGRISLTGGPPSTGPPSINVGLGSVQQLGTDSQGNVWYVNSTQSQVAYIDMSTFTVHTFGPVPTLGSLTPISGLALGADNAMYFTEQGGTTRQIGRVTTPANGAAGTYSEFAVPNSSASVFPWDIAAGPDGNLWFVEFASVGANQFFGKFPPPGSSPTITEYAGTFDPNAFANLVTIAKGLDGNLWIAEGGGAVSITPATPLFPNVQFFTDNGQTTMVKCVAGPDGTGQATPGLIWCTASGGPALSPGFIPTTDSILSWRPR